MSIVPYAKATLETSDGCTASSCSLTYYQCDPAEPRPQIIEVLKQMVEDDSEGLGLSDYDLIKKAKNNQ